MNIVERNLLSLETKCLFGSTVVKIFIHDGQYATFSISLITTARTVAEGGSVDSLYIF